MRDWVALAVSFAVTALAALAIWRWLRGSRTRVGLRAEPDRPRGFGYKATWLAVRADDPQEVVDALRAVDSRFRDAIACNWEHGLQRALGARASSNAFVTPSLRGWVLVPGYMPDGQPATSVEAEGSATLAALEKLGDALGRTVHYFGSHRGVGYVDWVVVENGRVTRAYAHADGTTYYDIGEPTPDEKDLGLVFHDALQSATEDEADAIADRLPDESTVIELASRWTIDPTGLEAIETPSAGTLVRLG